MEGKSGHCHEDKDYTLKKQRRRLSAGLAKRIIVPLESRVVIHPGLEIERADFMPVAFAIFLDFKSTGHVNFGFRLATQKIIPG